MLVNGLFHNQLYIISDSKQSRSNQEHFPMVGCCPFVTFYFHVLLFWGKFSACSAVGDDDDERDYQVDDQIGEKVDAKNDKLEEELVDE